MSFRNKRTRIHQLAVTLMFTSLMACKTNKTIVNAEPIIEYITVETNNLSGGSSGMEQIDANSYIAVYDLKRHKDDTRVGLIRVNQESFKVDPIEVADWGSGGIANDLESICAIPGRSNEYFLAESGDWQETPGRVFHLRIDTSQLIGEVLGSISIPIAHKNDFGIVGDQYEGIIAIPQSEESILLVLAERGGSEHYPHGLIKWGLYNLKDYSFSFDDQGQKGLSVDVPGNWLDSKTKRDITDFHVDDEGAIWASASEDQGDAGPFYSVVYKLGTINMENNDYPIDLLDSITVTKEIYGFKIEALSGACKDINSSHSFGTEDENYGGVWRPIEIKSNKN